MSELSKTRKFHPPVEIVTRPFTRAIDDATVRFSRPYERVEITDPGPDPIRVDLDLSVVRPIEDDTLPFALDDVPERASEPYAMIEVALNVPAVAEPFVLPPAIPVERLRLGVILVVALVMIGAFACGVGVVFAVS